MPLPTIVIHAGTGTIASNEMDAYQAGCLAAIEAGWMILRYGGSAKDAVEAAIRSLEADPTFNPSIAICPSLGRAVFLDSAMMEGDRLRWGAVAEVKQIQHPISVARKLLDQKPMLLIGEGAERFASEQGYELYEPDAWMAQNYPLRQPTQRRFHDSSARIGCVALDASGLLAAGTSTSKTETNGSVSSTVIIGSGLYATRTGACVTSGDGGAIITVTLAKTAVDLLDKTEYPEMAVQSAIQHLKDQDRGKAGLILLDNQGQIGWTHNSEHMPVAYRTAAMDEAVFSIRSPIKIFLNLSDEFNPFHF